MDSQRQQPTPRVIEHQRAYKACIPCRKRKAKCDLAGNDGPPCARCRRELRECIFTAERSWTKKRKLDDKTADDTTPSVIDPTREQPLGQVHSREQGQASRSEAVLANQTLSITAPLQARSNLIDSDSTIVAEEGSPSRTNNLDPEPELTRSVMRTVVSNSNDVLNLLFQAAAQEQDRTPREGPTRHGSLTGASTTTAIQQPTLLGTALEVASALSKAPDVYKLWKSSKFVKMGWLSAREIVAYLDLFFKNLNPLSPVLSDYYASHSNHYQLANEEPLLCSTILMISSRHHALSGTGGVSQAHFVHERFWKFCQHLISRLLFGQEKGTNTKTRTLGSIEALLLLSEWHPRSLHFPPEADGWDSDLILSTDSEFEPDDSADSPNKWLEDVIEPSKRSDRMSWMLLGCALSLAHELNLFGPEEASTDHALVLTRKARARKLLYVCTTQLATRLGITSMLPHNLAHSINNRSRDEQTGSQHWNTHMSAWIELTKLLKSLSEMVFPSKAFTQQLLQSGRYVSVLEHFQPLLSQWEKTHLDQDMPESYRDILTIEYQYVRVYCNSIGMQAVCERALSGPTASITNPAIPLETDDQIYIEEVISGSCDMLEKAIALAEKDTLRFAPVRVFLRITTCSVFLLKAMSIGIRNGRLRYALGVLHRSVKALRSSVLDDMHLANSYAILLEAHIKRLQKSFQASSQRAQPSRLATRRPSIEPPFNEAQTNSNLENLADFPSTEEWDDFNVNFDGTLTEDDWLSLPFDPAMAPFGSSCASTFPAGMDDDGLNFIWNLPD